MSASFDLDGTPSRPIAAPRLLQRTSIGPKGLMRLFASAIASAAVCLTALTQPTVAGDPPVACGIAQHSCVEVALASPGCNDSECCDTVCTIEPACCSVGWDELCVALAVKFCSSCGISENHCIQANLGPGCNEPNCCNYVCSLPGFDYCCTVAWDVDCAITAKAVCNGCDAPGAGDCSVVHDTYGCDDPSCCSQVCAVDNVCCTVTWDEVCVQWAEFFCPGCGDPASGNCCVAHPTPFCDDLDCCDSVCAIDEFCCESQWDINCVEAARVVCSLDNCLCGDPNAGSCKDVHPNAGCNDLVCCATVCLFDDFCCVVTWDLACTNAADALCTTNPNCGGAGKGSCFVRHNNPGCDDAACCEAVCTVDPNCCLFQWDQDCADLAPRVCTDCGDITTGSCFIPHGSPACADADCCEEVCKIDPFCCSENWDGVCASFAQAVCDDPIRSCGAIVSRSCFIPSAYLPGCEDAGCCVDVCTTIDPFCCEVHWDAVCVEIALGLCGEGPGCPNRGSCLIPHNLPGCNEPICCTAVCDIDPICCINTWDEHCALFAYGVCFGQSTCPGSELCTVSHGTPGCEDPACCNVVCAIDPVCCIEAWDTNCVNTALARCRPDAGWNCPCIGSCFDAHPNPGCEDESCCSGVCSIDPECCTILWDADCALIARSVCCGDIGCGNWCAQSCFAPHDQPFCNDAACCEAVCTIDPFCCGSKWDGLCADIAEERCTGLCGNPDAGSCFVPKAFPGCNDVDCCNAVCAVDPVCCGTIWDAACVTLAVGTNRRPGLCELPECGDFATGDCCNPHELPACSDSNCCDDVCAKDPFCCDTQWDLACAGMARESNSCGCVQDCGDPCAGSCCEPHEYPLCNDEACCDAVCALDPFCCELNGGTWDSVCVQLALTQTECDRPCPQPGCGDPAAGDCCSPHFGPACSDENCCEDVCNQDQYCCDIEWDAVCALLAGESCDICEGDVFCGSSEAGSCFVEHAQPYCDDFGCCSFVCILDDSCCSVSWDATCVQLAKDFCQP
jgi:hypothetical protein